jgi:hypothetical protein
MKTEIEKHQQFKGIVFVLENHSADFEEKPDLLAAKQAFVANTAQIGEKLSQLMRPVSTVRSPKIDGESRLRKELSKMIGIGLSIAVSQKDQILIDTLKNYDSQWRRSSAYQLYENSIHVHEELAKLNELASGNGLTIEKLAAFKSMVDSFGETLDITGVRLTDRRRSRAEIRILIKTNNQILRFQIDTYVRFLEDESKELYNEYMFLRRRKRRKASSIEAPDYCDISGTVTDSETGEPLPNAVITLMAPETVVETDADGYYLLDELQAGELTFTCHLPGYEVPAEQKVTIQAGESLIIDFSLTPVTPPEETPTT